MVERSARAPAVSVNAPSVQSSSTKTPRSLLVPPALRRAVTAPVTPLRAVSNNSPLDRSEEHTSELQSLMRILYAVFCLKKITRNRRELHYITFITIYTDIHRGNV